METTPSAERKALTRRVIVEVEASTYLGRGKSEGKSNGKGKGRESTEAKGVSRSGSREAKAKAKSDWKPSLRQSGRR